jgi:hypothetical protein
MTDLTEHGVGDAAERSDGRGGMSRRQMIRAAALTGAAAWTAPMIIDSLSSPAAATSGCVKYYAKLDTSGKCIAHDPSCGFKVATGVKYVCCSSDTSGEDCPYPAKLPTLTTLAANTDYFQVELKSGCTFLPLAPVNDDFNWQVIGNYDFTTPCPRLTGTVGATAPTASYTGDGYFQVDGNKAWIRKDHYFSTPGKTIGLSYIYLQFCCG